MVVTKGTLSIMAEKMPENHKTIIDVVLKLLPDTAMIFLDTRSITPVSIRLSTIINSPIKKKMVAQSISLIKTLSTRLRLLKTSNIKPDTIAIAAISSCKTSCSTKAVSIRATTIKDLRSSFLFEIRFSSL